MKNSRSLQKIISAAAVIIVIAAAVFSMTGCRVPELSNDLADGTYYIEIDMEGGSGRASVESPAELTVQNGSYTVKLVWSSSSYDYMIVDDVTYDPVEGEEYSTFLIPVTVFDEPIEMIADTTAMSTPHEITYKFTFLRDSVTSEKTDSTSETEESSTVSFSDQVITERNKDISESLSYVSSLELSFAKKFAVDFYEDDHVLITVASGDRFLLLPEGGSVPNDLAEDIYVIESKPEAIYLAASAAMDMFVSADAVSCLSFSSFTESSWYIQEAKDAMASGDIVYAGKYSAPDYELLLEGGCDLAIESTMIYHTPEVKEKLEGLGIPVIVDCASYEDEPLGRSEWVKLYGVLTGNLTEAQTAFEQEEELYKNICSQVSEDDQKDSVTVAVFYITSNGKINVRKPSDYLVKMIESAGGTYFLSAEDDEEENASSVMSMDAESFYAAAKDVDILIYSSTIEGEVSSVDELIEKNPLLANFKAVNEKTVYCTSADLYQSSMNPGDILLDMYNVIHENAQSLSYLYSLSNGR